MTPFKLREAARTLRQGGIVAYPTEAVFGLGCDPLNPRAIQLLLDLKRRPRSKGLILIAASTDQLTPYVSLAGQPYEEEVLSSWPGPNTWILPARENVPSWITGSHSGIAVRVTNHPLAASLCRAFGSALVSTSANRSGTPAARNPLQVLLRLPEPPGMILHGATGGASSATTIRDALTGRILRS